MAKPWMLLGAAACAGVLVYLYVQTRSDVPPPRVTDTVAAPPPGERVYPPSPVPVAPSAPPPADTPPRRSEVPEQQGLRGHWTREYEAWKKEASVDPMQETALVQALGKSTAAYVAADKLPRTGEHDEARLDAMSDAANAFAGELKRILKPDQLASFEKRFSDGVILIRAQIVEP